MKRQNLTATIFDYHNLSKTGKRNYWIVTIVYMVVALILNKLITEQTNLMYDKFKKKWVIKNPDKKSYDFELSTWQLISIYAAGIAEYGLSIYAINKILTDKLPIFE